VGVTHSLVGRSSWHDLSALPMLNWAAISHFRTWHRIASRVRHQSLDWLVRDARGSSWPPSLVALQIGVSHQIEWGSFLGSQSAMAVALKTGLFQRISLEQLELFEAAHFAW